MEYHGLNEQGNSISDCCNFATVESTGAVNLDGDTASPPIASHTGGITGHNYGATSRCINKGIVTANQWVCGGIVGRNNSTGVVSYSCNLGNVTANKVVGGIVGNNRGQVIYTYNMAEEIKARTTDIDSFVGGISGNQNTQNSATINYSYNTGKITGNTYLGGIIGQVATGVVDRTYNIGTLNTTKAGNIGQIDGYKYGASAVKNSSPTTEEVMKGWPQSLITTNLGNFVKKENGLPILNITIRDIIF